MKRLNFAVDGGKERYEILYGGVIGTTRGFQAPSETRVIGKVLDKLEAVGKSSETVGQNGATIKSFILNDQLPEVVVDLENAEFDLMLECLQAVRWTTSAARKATAAIEWFQTAKEPEGPKA